MSINVTSSGAYVEANDLYVAKDSSWIHIPLDNQWLRPSDWLEGDVEVGEQKIQALIFLGADPAVEANRVMALAGFGAFTVDWGDGTAPQNYIANGVATHLYDTSGLTTTSDGWKQAMVTITPQAGQTLSIVNFSNVYYTGKTWRSPVIEVVAGSSLLTAITFGGLCPLLRRLELKEPFTPTTPVNQFFNCYNLHEVVGEIIVPGTNTTGMFLGCTSLKKFPTLTLTAGAGVNATNMFSGCQSMVEPPPFNTSGISIWTTAFANCYALKRMWDGFNLSSTATQINSTWTNCVTLEEMPLLNTVNVTTFSSTFSGCTMLRKASFTDTSKVTSMANLFLNCPVLQSVTGIDASTVSSSANFANFVGGCLRLCELEFLPGKGPRFTWTVVGMIDTAGLNAIYTALPTITGQTITVTSLPGTLADDPTIATAKGWTVTGS